MVYVIFINGFIVFVYMNVTINKILRVDIRFEPKNMQTKKKFLDYFLKPIEEAVFQKVNKGEII